jgi:hypothetical protein
MNKHRFWQIYHTANISAVNKDEQVSTAINELTQLDDACIFKFDKICDLYCDFSRTYQPSELFAENLEALRSFNSAARDAFNLKHGWGRRDNSPFNRLKGSSQPLCEDEVDEIENDFIIPIINWDAIEAVLNDALENKAKMNINQFWNVIDFARANTNSIGCLRESIESELSKLETKDAFKWEQIYSELLDISCKRLLSTASDIIFGIKSSVHMTDEAISEYKFFLFQRWLFSQGSEVFLNVMRDPDCLAHHEIVDIDGCINPDDFFDFSSLVDDLIQVRYELPNPPWYFQAFHSLPGLDDDDIAEINASITFHEHIDTEVSDKLHLQELLPNLCSKYITNVPTVISNLGPFLY